MIAFVEFIKKKRKINRRQFLKRKEYIKLATYDMSRIECVLRGHPHVIIN